MLAGNDENRNGRKGALMDQRSLTPEQAREEFFPQIGRAAFYTAIRRNQIPHLRVGKKIIIPRAALERLFDSCGRTAADGKTAA
jgi:hypothetical protein